MMDDQQIANLFEELEKEINQVKDKGERTRQMAQLERTYKDYKGEDRLVSSHEIAENLKTKEKEELIPTGYGNLDAILGGFRRKQLNTISAATSSGKTTFSIELISRMKEYSPVMIPFEDSAEELIERFVERNETPPLFYTPETITDSSLEWIERKIIEGKIKYGSTVFFIDHLHYIVPFSSERQDLMVGKTMRSLKEMAKQWDVVIFTIAHLKKTKPEYQPDIESLRDSSFIAQESDIVLMLWRESKREKGKVVITDNVNLSVQKHRRTGRTGNVSFVYDKGRFLEMDMRDDEDESESQGDL